MIQKTSAPGSAEPQLRNACLSFWSVEAELGLRVPGKEGPVFFKIWYKAQLRENISRTGERTLAVELALPAQVARSCVLA